MPLLRKSRLYRYRCNSDGVDVIPIEDVIIPESRRVQFVEVYVIHSCNSRIKSYVPADAPVAAPGPAGAGNADPAPAGAPDAAPGPAGAPDAAPDPAGVPDAVPAPAGAPDADPAPSGAPDADPAPAGAQDAAPGSAGAPDAVPAPAGAPDAAPAPAGARNIKWDALSLQRLGKIVVGMASSDSVKRRDAFHDFYAMRRMFDAAIFDAKVLELDRFRSGKGVATVTEMTWTVAAEVAGQIKKEALLSSRSQAFYPENRNQIPPATKKVALPAADETTHTPIKQDRCSAGDAEQMSLF